MFAAIYVGSSELVLKIYEISKKNSYRVIDSVSRIIELGKDTYSKGSLSTDSIKEVCGTLESFLMKMKEYDVRDYKAYATSAIREADNMEMILDTIARCTGIEVEVLSNSEQRYISYKGLVTKYDEFVQVVNKNTAFVDVGAGSVQVSLFNKDALVLTENIHIGAVRIRDYLSIVRTKSGRLDKIISEYVDKDIETFRIIYLNDKEIKNIIAVGEVASVFRKILPEIGASEKINREQFEELYSKIINVSPEELSERYGIPYERATLMLPNVIIYESFLNNCKAEEIYIPNVDFCDGIVADYLEKEKMLISGHSFDEDIISSAYYMCKRYRCNKNHIDRVSELALKIFDGTKKIHNLGSKERLQLQLAAILHECGNFVSIHDGALNSYYIIAHSEIIGLSHKERMEVANIVKYNVMYLPPRKELIGELGPCDYMTIAKLVSILRIANVLDKSHTQKIGNITVAQKNNQVIITTDSYEDIALENGLFENRADFFEKVYGMRPVLKVKRSV